MARPDKDVDRKRYLIIHAETGDTVPNIKRLEVTEDHCRLLFGPVTQKYVLLLLSALSGAAGWRILWQGLLSA